MSKKDLSKLLIIKLKATPNEIIYYNETVCFEKSYIITLKKYATKHYNIASQIIVKALDHMVCKVPSSVQTTHAK